MAWKLKGTHFETCSCEVVCPCTASFANPASVTIGDAVDFEIEDIVPAGVEGAEPVRLTGIAHPAGPDLAVSRATRASISAFGIEYEAKSGFSRSHFSWAA